MLTSTMAASGAVTATMAMAVPTAIQNSDIFPSFLVVGLRVACLAETSSRRRHLVLYSPSLSL